MLYVSPSPLKDIYFFFAYILNCVCLTVCLREKKNIKDGWTIKHDIIIIYMIVVDLILLHLQKSKLLACCNQVALYQNYVKYHTSHNIVLFVAVDWKIIILLMISYAKVCLHVCGLNNIRYNLVWLKCVNLCKRC